MVLKTGQRNLWLGQWVRMGWHKYSWQFGQIQFAMWRNAFWFWTNTFCSLDKYRPVLNTGQRNLCDWDDESGWVGTAPAFSSSYLRSSFPNFIFAHCTCCICICFVFEFQSRDVFVSPGIILFPPLINISFFLFGQSRNTLPTSSLPLTKNTTFECGTLTHFWEKFAGQYFGAKTAWTCGSCSELQ